MPGTGVAALGFRSKTGRAVLVALGGGLDSPRLLLRREIALSAPEAPATFQPYHSVMELPWADAVAAATATESIIEDVATAATRDLIAELGKLGHRVIAIGVVGSPDRELTRIGNRHMRSHAAEGILFRRVLEVAATRNDLPASSYSDRDVESIGCERIAWPPAKLKALMLALGRAAGPPWRADERLAATAALLSLHSLER